VADILHDFPIKAPLEKVFEAVSTPEGLSAWWTLDSDGHPTLGASYRLGFGPGYQWEGVVTSLVPDELIEWEIVAPDPDWHGTRVGMRLERSGQDTRVHFHHVGWPSSNDHYRTSNYCWAMYLRLLGRWVETGERVPYADRLDA